MERRYRNISGIDGVKTVMTYNAEHKNTHTSRAKQVQKTSMQAALEEEREALSQTAQRNASRYSEAEDTTKDFIIG